MSDEIPDEVEDGFGNVSLRRTRLAFFGLIVFLVAPFILAHLDNKEADFAETVSAKLDEIRDSIRTCTDEREELFLKAFELPITTGAPSHYFTRVREIAKRLKQFQTDIEKIDGRISSLWRPSRCNELMHRSDELKRQVQDQWELKEVLERSLNAHGVQRESEERNVGPTGKFQKGTLKDAINNSFISEPFMQLNPLPPQK